MKIGKFAILDVEVFRNNHLNYIYNDKKVETIPKFRLGISFSLVKEIRMCLSPRFTLTFHLAYWNLGIYLTIINKRERKSIKAA